jgi:hypothetical protein
MTAWIVLAGFVAIVAVLAALNSRRTRGRACCAPADPAADLRMRDALNDNSTSAAGASRD